MRSPEVLKQNEGVASLEDVHKFLSQDASLKVHDFFKHEATHFQQNFATQLAVKLEEENKEIDEYEEFLNKEIIPESFDAGSNIPDIDEPDDETGRDDDWKDLFGPAGDEQPQGEDEGSESEPSVTMAD
eukprot:Nk52_evm6s418 gene=Nk52_evmTU6s418